jgi:predicted nuclease of predicted toxin-antitoxin system
MRIRFQADNDLNGRIIDAVLRLNHVVDFAIAAHACFHKGTDDPEVLRLAAEDDRVLVSHDLRTLPWYFASFIETHNSPGLIIISQSLPHCRRGKLAMFDMGSGNARGVSQPN